LDSYTYTPMFMQYWSIKAEYQDCILFYRLGDFYEMFFEDAVNASNALDLKLTGRDCGLQERAPMCGIPYHAYESYLAKLVEKGYKVAICEQITPPDNKGIVKREVVRIVTGGTVTESSMLTTDNNYLCSVYCESEKNISTAFGVAWADITTAEYYYKHCTTKEYLFDLLIRIKPKEIICNDAAFAQSLDFDIVKSGDCVRFSKFYEYTFDKDFAEDIIKNTLGPEVLKEYSKELYTMIAIGSLLAYINHTQKKPIQIGISVQNDSEIKAMSIHKNARRTLEIDTNLRDGNIKGSLYSEVNFAHTDMGKRLVKRWLNSPSLNIDTITKRQDTIQIFNSSIMFRDELSKNLSGIKDLERLATRLSQKVIKPNELLILAQSLKCLPKLQNVLKGYKNLPKEYVNGIIFFDSLIQLVQSAIDSDPNDIIRDGGVIAKGYDKQLDGVREVKLNVSKLLTDIENKEKSLTNIKNLKVSYNKVHGYFVEIPKSNTSPVPYRYTRKQTTANAERYTTDELKQLEQKILTADEEISTLEQKLYNDVLDKLSSDVDRILQIAKHIAIIDALCGFAILATKYNYFRPVVTDKDSDIIIKEGRHPVAENILKEGEYVPNDTTINDEQRTLIITGPNMSGKSIYMRGVALITILAQCGSFVPASYCKIGIVDSIFTRVGAGDDMHTGQSTFMVEMSEVAEITKTVTDRSLLLLDEVGRGTATYDGLSIAWAIIEYFTTTTKARTIFSTHYHELTHLESVIKGCVNYKMTVQEAGDRIIFIRKLLRGTVNKSFGIEVAKLSGLPKNIISRAKQILDNLETNKKELHEFDIDNKYKTKKEQDIDTTKISIIVNMLKNIDIDDISPRNAYDILCDICTKIRSN